MPSSPRPWRLPPPAAATTPSRVVAGRRLSPSRARWPAPASPEAAAQTGAPATGSTAIGPAPNASRRPRNFCRRRQQRELPDPLPPGTELDGTSRSSAASHGPPRAGPSASLPTQASPRPGTASRPSAQQPPGRLLPLSRPAQVAESSASVSDVRTRSTTSVRLLHGGILLPSGISGSFKTSRAGKFASLCDTCLESKVAQNMTRSRIGRPPKNLSPGTKTTTAASPTSSYGAKTTRAGSPTSYGRVPRNFYPVAKTPSAASPTSSGRVPKNFSPGSKPTSAGRITRKDNGLHKLVFMSGILPEGADVGYYVGGKRLLDGYIKELGIYCNCCNTVVSPSQFEGHASRAARRKPQNDDLCSICSNGGELLLCDSCPRAFHRESVGLSSVPKGAWCCRYCESRQQRECCLAYNNNAIAAGRVDGVDSIGQIFTRSIRIATAPQGAFGGCALCKQHDFGKKKFSERTVLLCDQCGREFHVGCLKEHNMADLTALPEGAWYCSTVCVEICEALKDLVDRGAEPVPAVDVDLIKKKRAEKGLNDDGGLDVRWRVLRDKSSEDSKLVLSKAVAIFHESFDPIIQAATGRDLIPAMVYGRSVRDQDYTGMYCAVLTVGKTVVSAGLFRVMGCVAAELPLVATTRDNQGLGYFQALFACIERLLSSLKVKHFVLPAADEAVSIWTQRFGFGRITQDELLEHLKGGRPTVFHGTSTLHKPVPVEVEAEADVRGPEEVDEAPVPTALE